MTLRALHSPSGELMAFLPSPQDFAAVLPQPAPPEDLAASSRVSDRPSGILLADFADDYAWPVQILGECAGEGE